MVRTSCGVRAQTGGVTSVLGRRGLSGLAPSLPNLHVIGWEEAICTPAHTAPPALVNHLNIGDDVIRVKGDLVITSWNRRRGIKDDWIARQIDR